MRVALVSDLHANLLGLEAVAADARRAGVDRVVCLGDVATLGPHPREILERVRDLADTFVLGNHDEFLLDPQLVHGYAQAPVIVDAVDWCRAQLDQPLLDFVRGFVREAVIDLDGASLHLFHGSPRSNMEDLLATTPAEQLDQALAGARAAVLAGGHTHLQMVRQHRGALLVNPGSVGLPIRAYVAGREPEILDHAEYAIVEGDGTGSVGVTLRRVRLDRAALRSQADSADHPLRASLVAAYR